MMKRLKKITGLFLRLKITRILPDAIFLKIQYKYTTGRRLDYDNLVNYNEKIQYLKLTQRENIYTEIVDKIRVRDFVSNRIGKKYLIPIYGVYESLEEINFDVLPNKYVLKTNHNSGGYYIVSDNNSVSYKDISNKLKPMLRKNYYYFTREWPYKNIEPRIICEKYLEQGDDNELRDYRFFCFDGQPRFVAVDLSITDKSKVRRNIYDLDWNLMSVEISYPQETKISIKKPNQLSEMIDVARKLSKGFKHVRVDLYCIDNKIYFGEMTLYHQSGYGDIKPESFHEMMGSWIKV